MRYVLKREFLKFKFLSSEMCQCLPCGCCWWNCCADCGLGCAMQCLCSSMWMCKGDQLNAFNHECCECKCTGCGSVCCCFATIFCAEEWVKKYYAKKQSKDKSYEPWFITYNFISFTFIKPIDFTIRILENIKSKIDEEIYKNTDFRVSEIAHYSSA